jgi:2-polyprenyl-3-methyl-5-hydroxy-6-metoxy-1,4-benzoquinol methylase
MYGSGLFDSAPFSAATCCQVLEHVPDPRSFLAQIRADLDREAWLYLEVPDESDFGTLEINHDRFMSQHISYFSKAVLSQLLEDQGFEVFRWGIARTVRQRNNLWFIAKTA